MPVEEKPESKNPEINSSHTVVIVPVDQIPFGKLSQRPAMSVLLKLQSSFGPRKGEGHSC